ncbi:MAG: hypothetical protein WCJ02_15030 [bacterium]
MKKLNQHVEQMRRDTKTTLEKIRNSPGYAETAAEIDHEYEVARAKMSIGSPLSCPPDPSFQHSTIPVFQKKIKETT